MLEKIGKVMQWYKTLKYVPIVSDEGVTYITKFNVAETITKF